MGRGRSKSLSGTDQRASRAREFGQGTGPNRGRSRSVSGTDQPYVPPRRVHQPDPGMGFMFHITHPDNLGRIQQAGGLMPSVHQPATGVGLDQMTDRRGDHTGQVASDVGAFLRVAQQPGFAQVPPRMQESLRSAARTNARRSLQEGTNPQNVYMSFNQGSTQDYMTSFLDTGAVILRARRATGDRGFVRDQQGKAADHRSLGTTIQSRDMEYLHLSGDRLREVYDKPASQFNFNTQKWLPVAKQTLPRTDWAPGQCRQESIAKHRDNRPDKGGPGTGAAGGGSGRLPSAITTK